MPSAGVSASLQTNGISALQHWALDFSLLHTSSPWSQSAEVSLKGEAEEEGRKAEVGTQSENSTANSSAFLPLGGLLGAA